MTTTFPDLDTPNRSDPGLLSGAAAVIRTWGLGKGYYHDPSSGKHCTVGALREVAHTQANSAIQPELDLVAGLIGGVGKPIPCSCGCGLTQRADAHGVITRWNDAPERTAEQAVELLERAAAKAKEARS